MSNGYDENHDYTEGETATAIEAEDFVIAPAPALPKSAQQIEEENSFDVIPPGQYQLKVIGFLGKPERKRIELYATHNGQSQRYGIDAYNVAVKLGLPEDPSKQVTDNFLLPPSDEGHLWVYLNGNTKPPGTRGFSYANKFYHFIERLFPGQVQPGQTLPDAALALRNWISREIVATIVEGNSYTKKVKDTDTGEEVDKEMAGRNQVKLYSYREPGTPVSGPAQPTGPMRAPGTPAGPNGVARPPARTAPQPSATTVNPGAPTAPRPQAQPQPRGPVAPNGQRPAVAPQPTAPRPTGRPTAAVADRGLNNI